MKFINGIFWHVVYEIRRGETLLARTASKAFFVTLQKEVAPPCEYYEHATRFDLYGETPPETTETYLGRK